MKEKDESKAAKGSIGISVALYIAALLCVLFGAIPGKGSVSLSEEPMKFWAQILLVLLISTINLIVVLYRRRRLKT